FYRLRKILRFERRLFPFLLLYIYAFPIKILLSICNRSSTLFFRLSAEPVSRGGLYRDLFLLICRLLFLNWFFYRLRKILRFERRLFLLFYAFPIKTLLSICNGSSTLLFR